MAYDGDVLQVKVFSDVSKWASRAIASVTTSVNEYLRNYPADLVHSVTTQVTEFRDTGGDYPQGEEMTRYTVTVVLRS